MIFNTSNLRVARRSYFLNYGGESERWLPPENIAAAGFRHLISTDIGAYLYKAVQRRMLQESVWMDPAIVIEKYVTNAENSFYRVYFSGESHHRQSSSRQALSRNCRMIRVIRIL